MQIYFHHRSADAAAPLTQADWDRHAHFLEGSATALFGSDPAQFRTHAPGTDVLVTSPMGVRELLPLDAPRLRLLFVTCSSKWMMGARFIERDQTTPTASILSWFMHRNQRPRKLN